MISDNFVGALAILLIFGAPIAAWVISRVLAHQERIEMIRRGIVPPPGNLSGFGSKMPPPVWGPGSVPPPPPPPAGQRVPYQPYDDYYYARTQMRKGIKIGLIGLALLIVFGGPFWGGSHFGPFLLIGLIPLFVGIAQIINAVMNGAQLPGFGAGAGYGQGQPNFGPPPPPPPSPPPGTAPPPPAGPYAWRPGPTPEIEQHDK